MNTQHYKALESMYKAAPINSIYLPAIEISEGHATIEIEPQFFVLTTSFTTYLTRPVSSGSLRATGKVVYQNKSQFISESVVYDLNNNEIGRGNGVFVRGKFLLADSLGYVS